MNKGNFISASILALGDTTFESCASFYKALHELAMPFSKGNADIRRKRLSASL